MLRNRLSKGVLVLRAQHEGQGWPGMDTLRLRLVVWLPLVLAACGGGGSAGPGPASRTVAYVDSECREDAKTQTYSSQQTLQILNADRPPVTLPIVPGVSNLPASLVDMLAAQAGAPPGVGLCTLFGQLRYGPNSLSVGAFQRIGVSRDGSTVAFEVNLAFSYFLQLGLPNPLVPGEEGIYVVGADGSGLRRLGPPSRQASWVNPPGWFFYDISFSPDGRMLTFPDLGPGPDGETSQIFLQDVATGKRTQVTPSTHRNARVGSAAHAPECLVPRLFGRRDSGVLHRHQH
jgi:hypothetical protein